MIGVIIFVVIVVGIIFGALGAWVAHEKGRDTTEGFILGFLFAVTGVIVEGLLPSPIVTTTRAGEKPRYGVVDGKVRRLPPPPHYDIIGVDHKNPDDGKRP
jgi:hypothetical protein